MYRICCELSTKVFPLQYKLVWNFLLPVLSNLKFGNSFLSIMKTIEIIEFRDSYLQYKKKLEQYLFAKERNTITGTYSCWTKTWCMLSPAVAWFRQNEGFVPFLPPITWFQWDDPLRPLSPTTAQFWRDKDLLSPLCSSLFDFCKMAPPLHLLLPIAQFFYVPYCSFKKDDSFLWPSFITSGHIKLHYKDVHHIMAVLLIKDKNLLFFSQPSYSLNLKI